MKTLALLITFGCFLVEAKITSFDQNLFAKIPSKISQQIFLKTAVSPLRLVSKTMKTVLQDLDFGPFSNVCIQADIESYVAQRCVYKPSLLPLVQPRPDIPSMDRYFQLLENIGKFRNVILDLTTLDAFRFYEHDLPLLNRMDLVIPIAANLTVQDHVNEWKGLKSQFPQLRHLEVYLGPFPILSNLIRFKREEDAIHLLKQGANHNALDDMKKTVLMHASENGMLSLTKKIITKGANVNLRNRWGYSALSYAAMNGHLTAMKLLIQMGANVNTRCNMRRTPLILAAREGKFLAVKLLLENGASIDATDEFDVSALYAAADNNHLLTVKILLQYNAFPSQETHFWRTPLLTAIYQNYTQIAQVLLDAGANPNIHKPGEMTPLMVAASKKQSQIFDKLIANGAKRSVRDKLNRTAADYARKARGKNLSSSVKFGLVQNAIRILKRPVTDILDKY